MQEAPVLAAPAPAPVVPAAAAPAPLAVERPARPSRKSAAPAKPLQYQPRCLRATRRPVSVP